MGFVCNLNPKSVDDQFKRGQAGKPSTPERAGSGRGSLGARANGLHGAGSRSRRRRSSR